jgi:hypothetical protein
VRRSAGAVRRAEPLAHDSLAAQLAGLPVGDIAVADVVLVDGDARMRRAQQLDQSGLANLEGQSAQVLAV